MRSRSLATRFHHRLGHFLDKQWDTVSTLGYFFYCALRERFGAGDAINENSDFALPQAIKSERSYIRSSDPRRLELRRYVISSSTLRVFRRSTLRPSASRLVGSIQCTSSKIISTGFWNVTKCLQLCC